MSLVNVLEMTVGLRSVGSLNTKLKRMWNSELWCDGWLQFRLNPQTHFFRPMKSAKKSVHISLLKKIKKNRFFQSNSQAVFEAVSPARRLLTRFSVQLLEHLNAYLKIWRTLVSLTFSAAKWCKRRRFDTLITFLAYDFPRATSLDNNNISHAYHFIQRFRAMKSPIQRTPSVPAPVVWKPRLAHCPTRLNRQLAIFLPRSSTEPRWIATTWTTTLVPHRSASLARVRSLRARCRRWWCRCLHHAKSRSHVGSGTHSHWCRRDMPHFRGCTN